MVLMLLINENIKNIQCLIGHTKTFRPAQSLVAGRGRAAAVRRGDCGSRSKKRK